MQDDSKPILADVFKAVSGLPNTNARNQQPNHQLKTPLRAPPRAIAGHDRDSDDVGMSVLGLMGISGGILVVALFILRRLRGRPSLLVSRGKLV